jgi:hypothetical protein
MRYMRPGKPRRDQIVAVEFFLDRTILLGKIDGRANRGDQHQIVGIARYRSRSSAGSD